MVVVLSEQLPTISLGKLQAVENLPGTSQNIQAKTTELQTKTKNLYLLPFPSKSGAKETLYGSHALHQLTSAN